MLKRLLTALLVSCLVFCGCSSQSGNGSNESSDTGVEMNMELLNAALSGCIGWGNGKAGASLDALNAAVDFLGFMATNEVIREDETAEEIDEFVSGLSDDDQALFNENIATISSDIEALIAQDEETMAMLEDIGKTDAAAEYLKDEALSSKWAVLKSALANEKIDESKLESALNDSIGYGTGESGSSLSELAAAVNFLAFVANNDVSAKSGIADVIDHFIDGLSKDEVATFKENIAGIETTVESLIAQDKETMAMLEDINAEKEVEEYLKTEGLSDKWQAFKKLLDSALD